MNIGNTETLAEILYLGVGNMSDSNNNSLYSNFIKASQGIGKLIERGMELYNRIDWERFNRNFFAFLKFIDSLPNVIKELHIKLAVNGWFLINELELDKFLALLNSDVEHIDKTMCDYAEENASKLHEYLIETFPSRSKFIDDAFEAHMQGKYTLSVPMFLILSDGISNDMFNVSFYSKDRKKKEPRTKVKKFEYICNEVEEDKIEYIRYLLPLDLITSLNDDTSQLNKYGGYILNRHNVIHGYDTEYDTKINSTKGLVLLNYLADINNKYGKGTDIS